MKVPILRILENRIKNGVLKRISKQNFVTIPPFCHMETIWKIIKLFVISNLRRVLNVICFLLDNSPASEFYMPTFRNTVSVPSS